MRKTSVIQVVLSLILVLVAYFFVLDSIHIPNIGDEGVYIQIVRKTAESGHWLPLLTEEGIKTWRLKALFEVPHAIWMRGLESKIQELKPAMVIVHGSHIEDYYGAPKGRLTVK